MQREIMNGIPYLTDGKGGLYTWNPSNPVRIGTYNPDTKKPVLDTKCTSELQTLVEQWRTEQIARQRKPKTS